jgi:hypothetical protein
VVVFLGALAAFAIPHRHRIQEVEAAVPAYAEAA